MLRPWRRASCERVWVSHVAAAVKYESLVHTASVAATLRSATPQGVRIGSAVGYSVCGCQRVAEGWRALHMGSTSHRVAVPAACGYCGAWGVEAVSKVAGGKRHFGRECQEVRLLAPVCPSSSDSGSGSERSSGSSSGGDGQVHRPASKRKKRAVPANVLDDCMSELDCGRHPTLVPAGYEAELRQYIDIMFGSSADCAHHCGSACCIARVARKFARSANNSLCMSSISFEQGAYMLATSGGSGPAVGGYRLP